MSAATPGVGGAGILLLAAGRSRRFGSDKRLAILPHSDDTLLQATVRVARDSGLPVHVCLREGDGALATALAGDSVSTMVCPSADKGMGATLAEGVATVSGWDALIVALADMPLVRASTYRALARACSRQRIALPHYRGRRGNPACFGADWFDQLRRCSGDRGARDVLAANSQAVLPVEVNDAGILQDVDDPASLEAMR